MNHEKLKQWRGIATIKIERKSHEGKLEGEKVKLTATQLVITCNEDVLHCFIYTFCLTIPQ